METIVHGAFELVAVQQKISPGDIFNQDPVINNISTVYENYDYYNVITKNHSTLRNIATNEVITLPEGSFTHEAYVPPGRYETINDHYYEFFCFGPYVNANYLPLKDKIEPFTLLQGEETTVQQGKRIFMMEGAVEIAGKNYSGVNRLKFTSGDKKVTALRTTYGVYVK